MSEWVRLFHQIFTMYNMSGVICQMSHVRCQVSGIRWQVSGVTIYIISRYILPCESRTEDLFFHQHFYSFWIWPSEQVLTTFLEKLFSPKLFGLRGNLDFNSPMTWFWSLFESILAFQNTFLNNLLVFGWGYTLLANDWCTGYQVLSSSLTCYARNSI